MFRSVTASEPVLKVTLDRLRYMRACSDYLEDFEALFGVEADVTIENMRIALDADLYVSWLLERTRRDLLREFSCRVDKIYADRCRRIQGGMSEKESTAICQEERAQLFVEMFRKEKAA